MKNYKMGKYYFPTKQKRHNLIYTAGTAEINACGDRLNRGVCEAGSRRVFSPKVVHKGKLTKYQRSKQNKQILIVMVFFTSFTLTQAFFGITDDIIIDASLASENGAGVSAIANNGAGDVADIKANTSPAELTPYEETLSYEEKINPVEEEIRRIAKEHNFKWADYLVRLAECESSLNPNAVNDNGKYGKDWGLFQWNDYYNPEMKDCAMDIECSTIATMNAINAGKQSWWACDKIIKKNYEKRKTK